MIAKEVMQKKFVNVDKNDTVTGLIGKLKKANQTIGFVFDKDKFLGIVALKDLIKTRIAREEKLDRVIWHIPSIPTDEEVVDIATLMFHSNASALPVVKNEKVIGVVFAKDVIKQIKTMPELKKARISDIRHPPAKTIKETDRIGKAFEMMREGDINRLPVIDENKKLIGMISFGDIMKKFLSQPIKRGGGFKSSLSYPDTRGFKAEREDMLAMPVKSFASIKDIITAKPSDKITKIVDLMEENDISGIPITENSLVDSIVTKRDLLEAIMNTKKVVVKNIQYVGLKDLEDVHPYLKNYIQKISSYYAEKISYLIKNINNIKVHIKEYKKAGKAHKYSVHVQVDAPTVSITSTKAVDWDISRVMHKAFKDVEKQIIHKFRADTSYKKRCY